MATATATPATHLEAPAEEYRRRAARYRERGVAARQRAETISRARLGIALGAAGLGWLAFGAGWFSPWWLAVPAIVFAAMMGLHRRVWRERDRADRGVALYERGLARLDGHWAGTGRTGARFLDPHHPYAEDLDVFGEGSLYELLCGARTTMGEETLAAWLLEPSDPSSVRTRQAAVQALASRLDLREDLALLGEEIAGAVRRDALASLAASSAPPPAPAVRIGLAAITAMVILTALGWLLDWLPVLVPLAALVVQAGAGWRFRPRVRDADRAVAGHGPDLELLAAVLDRFEREPLGALQLPRLQAAMSPEGVRPSSAVRRLRLWVDLFDSRRNQFFTLIALLTMWDVHCALGIEAWRARHGRAVDTWLTAVGELEALCSLAGYAWEHPGDVYPELVEGTPCFAAEGLAHPLIHEARAVRNDVALGSAIRVLIVSGSNMSGKSTLLRAVGVNAILALAGAPVRAARLRLTSLAVGATLRVRDSLQEGTSRFYAELVRLRDLVRIAEGPVPLLFLLDEILHGTNSHDRRLGAAAVVRGLVDRGAVGLVTTHDLALSAVVDDPGMHADNVHFEDQLVDGQMRFDYRLRPGVVRTSNALALMRTLGLWSGPTDGAPAAPA